MAVNSGQNRLAMRCTWNTIEDHTGKIVKPASIALNAVANAVLPRCPSQSSKPSHHTHPPQRPEAQTRVLGKPTPQ